jgi:hypothetical protein
MSDAISAHGTLIARQNLGSGAFTTVGELRDITPPALTRNPIETSNQQDDDDSFVVGMRRRGELQFQIGFLPGDATHDEATGLVKSWNDGQKDGWRVTYPDGSTWIFSGYITNISPSAPTDDGLVADVTVRPTGAMAMA